MEGTADRPPDPPTFLMGHVLTDEEEAKVDKAEKRLEKYLSREGQVKTQIILSVSESLASLLQKQKTAKDTWDALVTEMTQKSKMVITFLQRQLRNMKCSEEDDLREYLDKAQDLFARLNKMGAKMENQEFLDIILGALLPSYKSVMNALTTSLEEVGKPIEIDSIIRILKSQYNKKKSLSTTQEEQGVLGAPFKKSLKCTNCKRKGHLIDTFWDKGGGKEGQGPKQKWRSKPKKKEGKDKANAAEESSSDGKSDESITFINYNSVTFIKDSTGATVIIDTGASRHMTPHQNILKNIRVFQGRELSEEPTKVPLMH